MPNSKRIFLGGMIVTYLLTVAGNLTSDRLQNVPILSYILSGLAWLNHQINSILFFKIELWIVIAILVIWYLLIKLLKSFKVVEPDYLEYTSDIVKEWVWKWSYKNYNGKYEKNPMTAYCPKCDVELRIDYSYSIARCPNCKKEWNANNNSYVMYEDNRFPMKGEWEDYIDTELIIAARINKYKKI